jgi:hypothetical protein
LRMLARKNAEEHAKSRPVRQIYWLPTDGKYITVRSAWNGWYQVDWFHDCPCGG